MAVTVENTETIVSSGSGVAIAALLIFAYSIVGRRLGRWSLTAPIIFMVSGWLLSQVFPVTPSEVSGLKVLAEATLAIVLFTDAAGVQPREIGADRGPVMRLLFIGLPLTIATGMLLAAVLWPDMPAYAALLLAAILAPTDAALGAATVLNKAVPVRIRRLLNVESGLNDGLATPVVLFAIAGLLGEEGLAAGNSIVSAVIEILLGVAIGAVVGFGAGYLVKITTSRGLASRSSAPVAVLMIPIFAYVIAGAFDGNGFIAAFVAGTAYAAAWGSGGHEQLVFAERVTEPLGDATWLIFGFLVVPLLLVNLDWREVVYAVAALTVLRMGPVALSLIGVGFTARTVAFIGWFGPRGLASVVFSLIVLEELEPSGVLEDVLATITLTIIGSVVLHGVTAAWGARNYGRWVAETRPPAETASSNEPTGRGRLAGANLPS